MQENLLFEAIIAAARKHGWKRNIAQDASGSKLTYRQLVLRAFLLAAPIAAYSRGQTHVAVMLPNTLAVAVTFLSVQALGKIPCMINFASGAQNIIRACEIAGAKTVLTSRAFIEQGKLEAVETAIAQQVKLVYLEDIRDSLKPWHKIAAALKAFFPDLALKSLRGIAPSPHDPAVILYTSGSEGVPKGVALSHHNILYNIDQVVHHITFSGEDRMFNPLPVFHSFGMTVGTILPLVLGIPVYLYPSPLHYKQIPPLVKKTGATIFLGTNTFYQGYANYAELDDFKTVRLAVAGGEKLKDATRELYLEKLGVDILQGYGVTETSPVISFNTPEAHKPGSVGRAFIGIETKVEPIEGLPRGGRLWVKGQNVMLGYMKHDAPGKLQPQDAWYDTGDIVEIDTQGYIYILGRAKRFAKIGGEMVSLAAVEDMAAMLEPEAAHAAVAIPDARKGEQIVLFTEAVTLDKDRLLTQAKADQLSELFLPKRVVQLEAMLRLGNGKVDYQELMSLAMKDSSRP